MPINEINKAIELLVKSSENNNQVAKATGIHPSTISNYRTKATRPSVPNARLIINYLTKGQTGETQTDNNSINPNNAQAMEVGLALDYIATLKEQLATMKEQLKEKDALIRQLTQQGGDGALSRNLGAVKERQDELNADK